MIIPMLITDFDFELPDGLIARNLWKSAKLTNAGFKSLEQLFSTSIS